MKVSKGSRKLTYPPRMLLARRQAICIFSKWRRSTSRGRRNVTLIGLFNTITLPSRNVPSFGKPEVSAGALASRSKIPKTRYINFSLVQNSRQYTRAPEFMPGSRKHFPDYVRRAYRWVSLLSIEGETFALTAKEYSISRFWDTDRPRLFPDPFGYALPSPAKMHFCALSRKSD
jgi:hypothetical protein